MLQNMKSLSGMKKLSKEEQMVLHGGQILCPPGSVLTWNGWRWYCKFPVQDPPKEIL